MKVLTDNQRCELLNLLASIWTPHDGQQLVGEKLFSSPADLVYVECGRKFGKSEMACYCCWVSAFLNDGAEIFYLAPEGKLAKKLVWYNKRMQTCNGVPENGFNHGFIEEVERIMGGAVKIYNSEARIELPNGSYIMVDGSDNYDMQRGLKPDFLVADEYRNFHPKWLEAVRPNMMVKGGKILFITTPPHGPNHAYDMARECKEAMESNDAHYYYLNLPSYWNNRIPNNREWLDKEQKRLEGLGKHNEWRREYMAEYIPSDEFAILPQLNRENAQNHSSVISALQMSNHRYDLCITLDPTGTTQFAALFGIYDPILAKLHIVDEIFEIDTQKTNLRSISKLLEAKTAEYKKLLPNIQDTFYMHNCKSDWMADDLTNFIDLGSVPSPIEYKDLEYGLNLIKDSIDMGHLIVTDNCPCLIKEAEMYLLSPETYQFPHGVRRLINCLRFQLPACGFTWEAIEERLPKPPHEEFLFKLGLNAQQIEMKEQNNHMVDADFGLLDNDDLY